MAQIQNSPILATVKKVNSITEPAKKYSSFSVTQMCPSPPQSEGWGNSKAPSVWWYRAAVSQPFHLTVAWVGLNHKDLRLLKISLLLLILFIRFRPNGWFSEYPDFLILCPRPGQWRPFGLMDPLSFCLLLLFRPHSPLLGTKEERGCSAQCSFPHPRTVAILHPSVGDAAAKGTAVWHSSTSSPGGNSVGRQEIPCLPVRMMFKHVGISVGTLC